MNGGWVTTGNVSCTSPAFGCWPIWPAPKSAFWLATACWISVVVMPSDAIRSGFIQMRMAWSGTPKIVCLAGAVYPLDCIQYIYVGIVGHVVRAVTAVLVE